MKWVVFTIIIILSGQPDAQSLFSKLGEFSNVDYEDDSEHCLGTSTTIWRIDSINLVGVIDIHEGLCGDPPCSFIRGKIENNQLEFTATDSIWGEYYSFSGVIENDSLIGKLNLISVNLKKEKDDIPGDWDMSLSNWCKMWSKVHRCNGVKKFCRDLPKK